MRKDGLRFGRLREKRALSEKFPFPTISHFFKAKLF